MTLPTEWVCRTIDLRQPLDGERVDLGREFDELTLKYGEPGVLRGYDWRGEAYMEVRQLDFATIPLDGACPRWMERRDFETIMRLVHAPQWVMIHAAGQKYSKPTTGKWVRGGRDFERLRRMKILGTVHA